MTCEIIKIQDNVLTVRLEGILCLADQEAVQRTIERIIGKYGSAKLLVIAENFQGWSKKDDWGDMAFLVEYGDSVAKMAIVGEARWKENAFIFAGKGLRETKIEFFTPDKLDEAEGWVRL
jgi:hypothetical protein